MNAETLNEDWVLIIDDDLVQRETLKHYSKGLALRIMEAENCTTALLQLKKRAFDIVLLDIKLPDGDGIQLLTHIRKKYPQTNVIIISSSKDINNVVSALRNGATDYIMKPVNLPEYRNVIENTLALRKISDNFQTLYHKTETLERNYESNFQQFLIGGSTAIQHVVDLVTRIAPVDSSDVLITGESGVGKDLVAKAIHNFSQRRTNGYYAVNCSSIPESLFESEFFGHTRQAFTGAVQDKKGAFEATQGGTVFLDEIGNLPISLQTKFLRVLENRMIRPVGSTKDIPIDVRVLSASNRDLQEMVQEGTFRSDLFHRLNAFEINIPPLRERKEDIKPLVLHFCRFFADLMKIELPEPEENVYEYLSDYDYPGNVRELKNIVRKAIILNDSQSSKLALKNFSLLKPQSKISLPLIPDAHSFRPLIELDNLEKIWIQNALAEYKFNVSKAAKELGISRTALNRKIKKYQL